MQVKSYPHILDEVATVEEVLKGRSLSRVGEGELKLALGYSIKSQTSDERLQREIQLLLMKPCPALICLPRIWIGMPAESFWRQFEEPRYSKLYGLDTYGSAFVSRADVAHHIDCKTYWDRISHIWLGKSVLLVSRGLKVLNLTQSNVSTIFCPSINAYSEIGRIEEEIGRFNGPILLALGATATVLATRLARKGLFAIDIGHLGRFMASAGAYSMERQALISDDYIKQNQVLHRRPEGYGGAGYKLKADVLNYAKELKAETILDYGCGQGTLKTALIKDGCKTSIEEYDPAIKGKQGLPKPADLVICTDVLEHIEPSKLTNVLDHLYRLTIKGAFFAIALRKANKFLPDGRNAHLTVADADFWIKLVELAGYVLVRHEIKSEHDVKLWLSK